MFPVVLVFISWCAGALTQPPQFYDLDDAHIHFNEFVTKFGKTYASEHERRHRFDIFKANLEEVNKLNKEENITVFGINNFMDLTQKEFTKTYTGLRSSDDDTDCVVQTEKHIPDNNVPDSFDWRQKNAVTRVKDQGNCGSCWAFSATGVLEGQYAIHHEELLELSEQQLIDCDYRSDGCCGGYPGSAINGSAGLQTYKNGIMSERRCSQGHVDHAVLLVGYGTENGIPYWTVKNSWSDRWGEFGYFRMIRGEGKDSCGMQLSLITAAQL